MRVEQDTTITKQQSKKPFKILHNVKREKKPNFRKFSSPLSDKTHPLHKLQQNLQYRKFSLNLPPNSNNYQQFSSPSIESTSFSNQQVNWPSLNSQDETPILQEKFNRVVDNIMDLTLTNLQIPNFSKMEEQTISNKSSITHEFREFQEEDRLQIFVKGLPMPYSSRLINYDEFECNYQMQKNNDCLTNLF